MKVCVVAARAGSKGLPGKNIKAFAGRPLLAHSVAQACDSGIFDVVAVSSDSAEYLAIGEDAGANLLIERPAYLATDVISKPPVLLHALQEAERHLNCQADVLVDLQPTSPLRRAGDIAGTFDRLLQDPDLINVVSVTEAKASPYYTLVEETVPGRITLSKSRGEGFGRRQDLPACYALNGAIYAWRRQGVIDALPALTQQTGFWLMPGSCGFDIDTPLDFAVAAFVAHHEFGWPETPL